MALCPNHHWEFDHGLIKVGGVIKLSSKAEKPNCKDCGKKLSTKTAKRCAACLPIRNRKVKNRPSKKELKKLIEKHSTEQLGKMYSVSGAAIRKWCKKYSLKY